MKTEKQGWKVDGRWEVGGRWVGGGREVGRRWTGYGWHTDEVLAFFFFFFGSQFGFGRGQTLLSPDKLGQNF